MRTYDREWDVAAAALSAELEKKSRRQFGVIGVSSASWQYSYAKHINDRYDANANRLAATFERCGVPTCTGSAELQDLDLADSIGHVSVSSLQKVFAANRTWVKLAYGQTRKAVPSSLWRGACSKKQRELLRLFRGRGWGLPRSRPRKKRKSDGVLDAEDCRGQDGSRSVHDSGSSDSESGVGFAEVLPVPSKDGRIVYSDPGSVFGGWRNK